MKMRIFSARAIFSFFHIALTVSYLYLVWDLARVLSDKTYGYSVIYNVFVALLLLAIFCSFPLMTWAFWHRKFSLLKYAFLNLLLFSLVLVVYVKTLVQFFIFAGFYLEQISNASLSLTSLIVVVRGEDCFIRHYPVFLILFFVAGSFLWGKRFFTQKACCHDTDSKNPF
jgi:hypothetical protein